MSSNNSHQQQRVVEDAPHYRSVQIQSAQVAPPVMPLGRTAVGPSKISSTSKINTSKAAVITATKPAWKVSQLRPVPSFYRLERTHLKIGDATCQEITSRIAACLKEESVSATFYDDEAMVEAETHDAITFTARLFQGDNNKIVVELQRQAGCCYLFQQAAKCLLRAAKGMPPANNKLSQSSATALQRTCAIPPSVPKTNEEEDRLCLEHGLELAAGLLKKDRLDAHTLAMESLTHLSRSSQCQCLVAKAILNGPLLQTLVSLIESWRLCDDSAEGERGDLEEQHCAGMHRLAMVILANCLDTLETEGELGTFMNALVVREQLCSPSLLVALVDELRRANQRPHDACQAARCLQSLLRHCPQECKPRLVECDGLAATAIALDAGSSCHAKLEQECHRLTTQLQH